MKTPDSTVVAGIPSAVILAGGPVEVPALTPDHVEIDNLKVSNPITDKDMTNRPFHGKAVFGDRTTVPGCYMLKAAYMLKTGAHTRRKFENIIAYLQTPEE